MLTIENQEKGYIIASYRKARENINAGCREARKRTY